MRSLHADCKSSGSEFHRVGMITQIYLYLIFIGEKNTIIVFRFRMTTCQSTFY